MHRIWLLVSNPRARYVVLAFLGILLVSMVYIAISMPSDIKASEDGSGLATGLGILALAVLVPAILFTVATIYLLARHPHTRAAQAFVIATGSVFALIGAALGQSGLTAPFDNGEIYRVKQLLVAVGFLVVGGLLIATAVAALKSAARSEKDSSDALASV